MKLLQKVLYKISPSYRKILNCQKTVENLRDKSDQFFNEINIVNKKIDTLRDDLNRSTERDYKFCDHYEYWRAKRIVSIVEYYGQEWFKNKKILELGCGYGDIGYVLATLGADVIFAEGRVDNCDVLRKRYPNNRVYQVNLENEWPFPENERFDMILHMGLLYHLDDFMFSLKKCALCTDNLVIETEVCDSNDPEFVLKINENSNYYDQSLIGKGSRPSAEYIENRFGELGFDFERVNDSRCNALFHIYDWKVENTKTSRAGLRRFWFCKKRDNRR